jgi:hypothetical protein
MDPGSDPAAGNAGAPSNDRLPAVNVHQSQIPDHMVMKLTRGHSCVLCQQRKVRCDKQKPCANCVKAQVECRIVPPQPPRRRRKKPHERDLIERLKQYEALLAKHGVTFEPIADEFKASDHAEDVADLGQDLSGLKTSPESSAPTDYNQGDGDEKSVLWLLPSYQIAPLFLAHFSNPYHRSLKYFPYFNGVRMLASFCPLFSSPLIYYHTSHLLFLFFPRVTVTRCISCLETSCDSERRTYHHPITEDAGSETPLSIPGV